MSGDWLAHEKDMINRKHHGFNDNQTMVNSYSVDFENNGYYYGQVFFSIDNILTTGKYTGFTLDEVFSSKPQVIIDYVKDNDIFITTNALLLLGKKHRRSRNYYRLLIERERHFHFKNIYACEDKLISGSIYLNGGKNGIEVSLYNGMTFKDAFTKDPKYFVYLIKSDYYFVYPDALEGLENLHKYQELSFWVNTIHDSREAEREWEEQKKEYLAEQEFNRMEIETGWKTALEDDPDAGWNID